jgi:diaminopimelate decarboxylase
VESLAASLPTGDLPAYLYDLVDLADHARAVRRAVPAGIEVFYAAKANPDRQVLRTLRGVLDGYEVSSGGELRHVAEVVPDARIAISGPGKTAEELALAVRHGVEVVHVESVNELSGLAALTGASGPGRSGAPGRPVDVMLRANPRLDVGLAGGAPLLMGGGPTPFGMDDAAIDQALDLLRREDFGGLRLRGVHAHLASGLDAVRHCAVADRVIDWVSDLERRRGLPPLSVNIGGGMAVPYSARDAAFDWADWARRIRPAQLRRPAGSLRIEPGRSVAASCGTYVTDVLDLKSSHGETFAVLRGGTHHLRTPAARGHDQPATAIPMPDRPPGRVSPSRPARPTGDRVTLVGQLCTPKDLLARGVRLPGLRVGDRVAFSMAGAYAWNISHHDFLMHPRPTFHYLHPDPGPTEPGT